MHEVDIDLQHAKTLFVSVQEDPFILIEIPEASVAELVKILPVPFRQFYVSDRVLDQVHMSSNTPRTELIKLKIPDPGSTMSGDFGEMLVAVMQAALEHPHAVIDPKKWRFKEDRTKPAPKSDVVQFMLPNWPESSEVDKLFCSEVKAKALKGSSSPIASALEDSKKDQTGRLALTLSWLRERAIFQEESELSLQIERFIKADAHPQAIHVHRAIAVISAKLIPDEVASAPKSTNTDAQLIVISVHDLKKTYSAVFDAIVKTGTEPVTNYDGESGE